MEEIVFKTGLPKWPALLINGKKVTKEQAAEIIIRTGGFSFYSNDKEFEALLYEVLGLKVKNYGFPEDWNQYEELCKKYGILELEYLQNARIVSSFVGGPHGWCSWGGIIHSSGTNIGKWPRTKDVYRDWLVIAEAFPYLELTCQLFNVEYCEDNRIRVIEYRVKDGKVTAHEPTSELIEAPEVSIESQMLGLLIPGRERGCTIDQFKEALKVTEAKIKEQSDE